MLGIASASPFDTLDGLPVHALVVHIPIVLLPLTALGAIVMALLPRLSVRFGPLFCITGLVAFGMCFVAQFSGLQLAKRVGKPAQHAAFGQQLKYYAGVLTVLVFILWIVDRQTGGRRSAVGKIVAGLVILGALATLYGTYQVGDTGARAVWGQVIKKS